MMGASPDEGQLTNPKTGAGDYFSAFAVGRFAVTRGEFATFVAATGHKTDGGCSRFTESGWKREAERNWHSPGFTQNDRHPVVCVTWNDAKAFAAWLSSSTGKRYRLLSEAEYVTRAGSTTPFWGARRFQRIKPTMMAGCVSSGVKANGIGDDPRRQFCRQPVGALQRAWQHWEWTEIAGTKNAVTRGHRREQPATAVCAFCAPVPGTTVLATSARQAIHKPARQLRRLPRLPCCKNVVTLLSAS